MVKSMTRTFPIALAATAITGSVSALADGSANQGPEQRCSGEPQRDDSAHGRREQHSQHRDERELQIAVEREQQQKDEEQRQRQNDARLGAGCGVLGVLPTPVQAVPRRQLDGTLDCRMASSTAPARSRRWRTAQFSWATLSAAPF
jgi:hypothetical protein